MEFPPTKAVHAAAAARTLHKIFFISAVCTVFAKIHLQNISDWVKEREKQNHFDQADCGNTQKETQQITQERQNVPLTKAKSAAPAAGERRAKQEHAVDE